MFAYTRPKRIGQINQENFGLVEFDKDKRDAILLECLERIASDKQIVGDISRTDVWEKGWQENL